MGKLTAESMEFVGSGLFEGEGVIDRASFGVKDSYATAIGSAKPMLLLTIRDADGNEYEQAYSLGDKMQWEASRDGNSVISGKDPDVHGWHPSCRAAAIVGWMFKAVGAKLTGGTDAVKNSLAGKKYFIDKGYAMTEAGFYAGEKFEWRRIPMDTVGGDSKDVLCPIQYLGTSAKAKATGKASPKAASTPVSSGESDVSEEDMAVLIEFCVGKTEPEVKSGMWRDANIKGNKTLTTAIMKGGLLKRIVSEGRVNLNEGIFIPVEA